MTPSREDVDRVRHIIDRCRRDGLRVVEVGDWVARGRAWSRVPVGVVIHHDASTLKSGEWGALGWIATGSPIAPLSLGQIGRGLSGPAVAIVAAGRANHAGRGGPASFGRHRVPADAANAWAYGWEAADSGTEPRTDAHLHARAVALAATLEVCQP